MFAKTSSEFFKTKWETLQKEGKKLEGPLDMTKIELDPGEQLALMSTDGYRTIFTGTRFGLVIVSYIDDADEGEPRFPFVLPPELDHLKRNIMQSSLPPGYDRGIEILARFIGGDIVSYGLPATMPNLGEFVELSYDYRAGHLH